MFPAASHLQGTQALAEVEREAKHGHGGRDTLEGRSHPALRPPLRYNIKLNKSKPVSSPTPSQ